MSTGDPWILKPGQPVIVDNPSYPEYLQKNVNVQPTGKKNDDGKPRMELLDAQFLEGVAAVMTFGAKKYAAHNWRGGISIGRLLGACLRHCFAFLRGEDTDPESGLHHLLHAGCCIMFAYWTVVNKPELDDRYKG